MNWQQNIIPSKTTIKRALEKLDILAQDAILFVIDEKEELIGSITDGDIRRGLLSGCDLSTFVDSVFQSHPRFIRRNEKSIKSLIEFRENDLKIIPVLADDSNKIVDIINFRLKKSYLPIDAVIMAGGEGQRLRPLTESTPKPLLKVGKKPIIEHTIDRLEYFGFKDVWLSVNYLAEQLEQFVEDNPKDLKLHIVKETKPLGTIGSVSMINSFKQDYILVCNSDLLTNLDYEAFFLDFVDTNADLSVVTIPYVVDVPYAVLDVSNGIISDFKEKPSYTYYSNGGIYLMKREMLEFIPKDEHFSAIDFMTALIEKQKVIRSFPHHGYWLDIGKHDDFKKAQEDVLLYNF